MSDKYTPGEMALSVKNPPPAWMAKAHRVINDLCRQSWYQANHDAQGRRYKRHRPYAIPYEAEQLVKCLENQDEEGAKAIFLSRV